MKQKIFSVATIFLAGTAFFSSVQAYEGSFDVPSIAKCAILEFLACNADTEREAVDIEDYQESTCSSDELLRIDAATNTLRDEIKAHANRKRKAEAR